MKTLSINSKKGTEFVYLYGQSWRTSLKECYKTMSREKELAEYLCRQKMEDEDGCRFRIISWNKFSFTCGWCTEKGIRIETARNSYLITK